MQKIQPYFPVAYALNQTLSGVFGDNNFLHFITI